MPSVGPGDELPAGITTLRRWAVRHGRTADYVRLHWRRREGFPEPVGELPARGRHGGGRGELVFEEAALEAWLAAQSALRPPERVDLSELRVDPDERITLGRFARLISRARNTVTQHRGRPGFPQPDGAGTYRAGDLFGYWNTRTGRRSPARHRADGS